MKPSPSAEAGDVSALSSLDDPVRRRLYDYVCERGGPVSATRPVPQPASAGRWRHTTWTSWKERGC